MAQPENPAICFGVAILAAGRSRRMGQPKLLLPWGKSSILGHLLEQWRYLGARQIGVVCAADDPVIKGELDRLQFPVESRIENSTPDLGMFSSIQKAATWGGWDRQLTHCVLVLGDQPQLRSATLNAMLQRAASQLHLVVQPARAGLPKHPVLLPKAIFLLLGNSRCVSLKEFLLPYQVGLCESDDPGLDLDLDRPEDYVKALRLTGPENSGDLPE